MSAFDLMTTKLDDTTTECGVVTREVGGRRPTNGKDVINLTSALNGRVGKESLRAEVSSTRNEKLINLEKWDAFKSFLDKKSDFISSPSRTLHGHGEELTLNLY